jgi:hypothetical protein
MVRDGCEGHNFRKCEGFKSIAERKSRCLGRIAMAQCSKANRQPISTHGGSEHQTSNFQSGKSNECEYSWNFDGPQAKPVFTEVPLDVIHHYVALAARKAIPKELHHARVGIYCGKCFPILITPSTQANAATRFTELLISEPSYV